MINYCFRITFICFFCERVLIKFPIIAHFRMYWFMFAVQCPKSEILIKILMLVNYRESNSSPAILLHSERWLEIDVVTTGLAKRFTVDGEGVALLYSKRCCFEVDGVGVLHSEWWFDEEVDDEDFIQVLWKRTIFIINLSILFWINFGYLKFIKLIVIHFLV